MTDDQNVPASRYSMPSGVEVAGAWSLRLLIIAAGVAGLMWLLARLSEVSVPIAIALLGTALLIGIVDRLASWGVPRIVGALGAVVLVVAALVGAFSLIGQQLSTQFDDLLLALVKGIAQVQTWARTGPLQVSDSQLESWIDKLQDMIASGGSEWLGQATQVGSQISHFVAGIFIVPFAMFFFLYEGERIWTWVVSFFPSAAREQIGISGRVAWMSLTGFVRATVLVALADALGIMLVAVLLDVPLAGAIGVLVFIGAFIPIVGALMSGLVAVLVALVAHGFWTAVFMLIGVIVVQQIESHVLQPFLTGRLVAIHPLAIILAIAIGIAAYGIVGALLAVPAAAVFNSIVRQLRSAAAGRVASGGDAEAEPSPG